MPPSEQARVVVDTASSDWSRGEVEGHTRLGLYAAKSDAERVTMERLAAGTTLPSALCPDGEEIFVLCGDLVDECGAYLSGTWIRNPAGYRRSLGTKGGVTYWAKRGHLAPAHLTRREAQSAR